MRLLKTWILGTILPRLCLVFLIFSAPFALGQKTSSGWDGISNFACETIVDGSTWCGVRDFGVRQQGVFLGTSSFLSFQSMNEVGKWGDWAFVNGGLIDRKDGNEQGDLDLIWFVDGRPSGVAGVGRLPGSNPAIVPIYDKEIDLGRPGQRFHNLHISGAVVLHETETPCPRFYPTRGNVLGCLQLLVGGQKAFLPIYKYPSDSESE